eukprot:EG_transcript_20636
MKVRWKRLTIQTPRCQPVLMGSSRRISGIPFSSPAYWAAFYDRRRGRPPFEWFAGGPRLVEALRRILAEAFGAEAALRAAYVGCGTSTLGLELHRAMPALTVTNFDAAAAAIEAMRPLHSEGCRFEVRDMLATGLPDGGLDVCLDKGSMDVLTHLDGDSGRAEAVARYCREMCRILRPGGMLLQVTEEPPEVRLEELRGVVPWEAKLATVLEVEEWAEPYYIYAAVKAAPGRKE